MEPKTFNELTFQLSALKAQGVPLIINLKNHIKTRQAGDLPQSEAKPC